MPIPLLRVNILRPAAAALIVAAHSMLLAAILVWTLPASVCQAQVAADSNPPSDIGFIGLHGGIYEQLLKYAEPLKLSLQYFEDGEIHSGQADLSRVKVLFIQHTRDEDRESYRSLFAAAKRKNPQLVIIAFQSNTQELFRGLGLAELLQEDDKAAAYYASSNDNLRRLLVYTGVTYLGREWTIEPPEEVDRQGIYHPDHSDLFASAEEFLVWQRSRRRIAPTQTRVLIAVHGAHLAFQQPKVIDALIREAEAQGAIAAAIIDGRSKLYEEQTLKFAPHVVVHTCHSTDGLPFRLKLDVPHVHSIFIRKQSISDWQQSVEGLSSSELGFHVIGQELLGGIEPQVAAGTTAGQGSPEAIQPIPDRVEHLVSRAIALAQLSRVPVADKRVGIVYYDREMGKGELMRGSATGMHMNGPRSLLNVLAKMQRHGYRIQPLPQFEDQLLEWMMNGGRQIGVWAPAELDKLARSGSPALIPAKQYESWYQSKIPADRRKQMEEKWGPPPGRFMVWEKGSEKFIVVPRIELGNVVLLPQPLRGELHGSDTASAQAHDKLSTPPHNYMATYFWLQEEFGAHALVHFGTHGSEFALPGKPNGLSSRDWPDILMGHMPNFNPWIVENMVESSPVRRRVYGTLISHLPPPIVEAGLSDELANLHDLVDKWQTLEEGALKDNFAKELTRLVRQARLDAELHLNAPTGEPLKDEQIEQVANYLHDLQEETTPISLHVFGEPPREDLLVPYLVQILRDPFRRAVEELLKADPEVSAEPDLNHRVGPAAEMIVDMVVRQHIDPRLAVSTAIGRAIDQLPEPIAEGLELATQINANFKKTTDEIDNLLRGLDGKFVPPGPGNSPIRNPSAVPTGRNMYLLNPEEVPTRPTWELGVKLAKQLIESHQSQHGAFPTKVGFDLRSSATFRDYGVMEAQILYLLGVEPIWDQRQLVNDVRLIPREQLGRPRIDVFIAAGKWYESNLPTRLQLWDKAIRLASQADEADNPIKASTLANREILQTQGVSGERALVLARGRIFGLAPGDESGRMLGYLVARSGDWNTRDDIATEYLAAHKYIYTEGAWGEEAVAAYDRTIQGTHTVVRSWSDHMTGPLASKYMWLHGGALSLAVEKMTGKRPDFIFSDVRDPDSAGMVNAEDALRREYRVRLFNRKWLEGMMKEGYAGADHMRVMVSNSFAWEVMRPGSVGNGNWDEMKRVLVDDKLNLGLRHWFEKNNPYAFQDAMAAMLEAARKGYWQADAEMLKAVAEAYAANVAKHGLSGHMTSGGNQPLHELVMQQISGDAELNRRELLTAYQQKVSEQSQLAEESAVASSAVPLEDKSLLELLPDAAPAELARTETATEKSAADSGQQTPSSSSQQTQLNASAEAPVVSGKRLENIDSSQPPPSASLIQNMSLVVAAALFLFAFGFFIRPRS